MPDKDRIQKSKDDKKFRPAEKLDRQLQSELDEALGDMSVESLLEAGLDDSSEAAQETPEGLQRGRVIAIEKDDIFVELGGKRQGILPATQYEDDPLPEVGQLVEFTIEGYDQRDGLLILSRKGAVLAATWETLEEGMVVEGRVTGHNKGGLELVINHIEAFMPISQIERFRVEEIDGYVNQKLKCVVVEVNRREGKLVVSRRDFLDAEAAREAEKLFETLQPGQTVSGVVRSIMPYGAFVDIGGVDGLLHVSDMSYARVNKPEDVVSEGDQVEVVVLKIDPDDRRLSLGLKQAKPDPWTDAETKWPVDDIVTGRVVRLEPFGAFVQLEPGVDGLVPISELSYERRVHHPRELLGEGDTVKVRVMTVSEAERRISLSLKGAGDDPWVGASVRWSQGEVVEGRVSRIADFGAFVELAPGVEGLVHISEIGQGFIRSAGQVVSEGESIQAKVISVDEDARRISLSIKQLAASPDYTGPGGGQTEDKPSPRKRKGPLKGGLD